MTVVGGGQEGLRVVTRHPWVGQQVVEPATGRTGRLGLVVEHLERDAHGLERERVVWCEAHVRPDDGSGIEWQANLSNLRRLPDQGSGR